MKLSDLVPVRMREIMEAREMEPADFIKSDNDPTDENLNKLTSSRFYEVLNGKNINPKIDFIQSFCDIAGIDGTEFFARNGNGDLAYFTKDEKEIIQIMRSIPRSSEKELLKYAKFLSKDKAEEK